MATHIRLGPPGPGDEEISDEGLGALILGYLRGVCALEQFPVVLQGFAENYNTDGDVESFTMITGSGLRYRVSVTLE